MSRWALPHDGCFSETDRDGKGWPWPFSICFGCMENTDSTGIQGCEASNKGIDSVPHLMQVQYCKQCCVGILHVVECGHWIYVLIGHDRTWAPKQLSTLIKQQSWRPCATLLGFPLLVISSSLLHVSPGDPANNNNAVEVSNRKPAGMIGNDIMVCLGL